MKISNRRSFFPVSCLAVVLALALLPAAPGAAGTSLPPLRSPGGDIVVEIRAGERFEYDVLVGEEKVISRAALALRVDAATFGPGARVRSVTPREHDGTVAPPVPQKAAALRDRYRELRLECEGGFAVTFRAYDEGVAYRWETSLPSAEVKVVDETVAVNFAGNHVVWYPEEQSTFSHMERHYLPRTLGDLAPQNIASLPAVVDTGRVKVAIAESDLEEYPGLWLRGTNGSGLAGTFAPYVIESKLTGDRDLRPVRTAEHIAVTKGTRTYPWRVLGVARSDGELITNALVYLLQPPSRVSDPSWIKPGKVAWDWWNANNLHGVDFETGINTRTYKYFIDFAAKNGLDYVILDEGWYVLGNVLQVAPGMDIPELVAYGRERNVGVILWVVWKTLDDQLEAALDQYAKWGARGIKVDFMQRADQAVIGYYHKVCRAAAERKLLVDFHGANQPALMTRTWPNLISTEGVRGLEWNKWSVSITPEHDATLPFTRMFLGPMDYTPGAMRNANRAQFSPVFDRPSSQGTRCHQLGLYVVFESPLQMLSDTPTNYEREPLAMEFLRAVPTVWDETRVLDARIADYALVARRRGSDWFLGAITDWSPRDLVVDLSFLPKGEFQLTEWRDGRNARRHAEDYVKATHAVTRATKLNVHLAEGGGWAAWVRAR
jgi:alpha-glucosidase